MSALIQALEDGSEPVASAALSTDQHEVRPMRYFLDGTEIDEATARDLEDRHCARVSRGASGVVPEELGGGSEPWLEMSALVAVEKVIRDLRIVVNLGGSAAAMLALYESRLGKVEPTFGWDRFDPSEARNADPE